MELKILVLLAVANLALSMPDPGVNVNIEVDVRYGEANHHFLLKNVTDECTSLSPPGFWVTEDFPGGSTCNDNETFPTKIFQSERQCCQKSSEPSTIDFVRKFAPILRFDSRQGNTDLCFPSSASDYYNIRKSGSKDRICNTDYNTMTNGYAPIYWKAMECGNNLNINYWFFYGYQDWCALGGIGAHDADWERIMVKVENYKTNDTALGPVMFYQHSGWCSRDRTGYEAYGTHPVVYVGKNAHGSYHDEGGSGGCPYWADYRKPGEINQYMKTWLNLEELRNDPSAPEFMRDENAGQFFDGIPSPLQREEIKHLCEQNGCVGSCPTIFDSPCGCDRSQIDEHTIF